MADEEKTGGGEAGTTDAERLRAAAEALGSVDGDGMAAEQVQSVRRMADRLDSMASGAGE